jgi:hypothetical protein
MTLLELVRAVNTSAFATKGGVLTPSSLPATLEVAPGMLGTFVTTWKQSEAENVEKGGNFVLGVGEFTLHNNTISSGLASGETVELDDLNLEDNYADFHTHPSDPSKGLLGIISRAYQPPSIEDVGSFAHKAGKKVYVAFVVANTTSIHALVFLQGVSYINGDKLSDMRLERDGRIEEYTFTQNKTTKMDFLNRMNALSRTSTDFEGDKNRALQALKDNASGYGKFVAELGAEYCVKACRVCRIGYYKGAGASLARSC